jgi:hypothetical protein
MSDGLAFAVAISFEAAFWLWVEVFGFATVLAFAAAGRFMICLNFFGVLLSSRSSVVSSFFFAVSVDFFSFFSSFLIDKANSSFWATVTAPAGAFFSFSSLLSGAPSVKAKAAFLLGVSGLGGTTPPLFLKQLE